MDALKTAILCVLWNKILQRFHSTSKSLQRGDMSLGICVVLYIGIDSFFQHLRDEFDTIKNDDLKLATGMQENLCVSKQTKPKNEEDF